MKQQLRVSDETEHQNTDPRTSFYLTFSFIRAEQLRGECTQCYVNKYWAWLWDVGDGIHYISSDRLAILPTYKRMYCCQLN